MGERLGSAEFELRRFAEALPPLTTALRRLRPLVGEDPPQASRVQAKVAWSLYHLGRYEEALVAFETGVRAGRDVHLFQAGMGWCYLRLQPCNRSASGLRACTYARTR
jgi:tetratricopeptide (TPR) repeat protein